MAQYDGRVLIDTQINTKNASAQLMTLENRIVKTADKIAALRSKMDALKNAQIPTEEYQEVANQIAKAETEFNKLLEKQEQMQREGKDNGVAWERLNAKMEEVGNTIRYAQGELQDLVDTGKAFTLGADTEKFANYAQKLKYAENDLSVLTQKHDELIKKQENVSGGYKKLADATKKAFNSIEKMLKKINSLVNSFVKRLKSALSGIGKSANAANKGFSGISLSLKNILKYGFGIRSLYVLINKIRSGIKEGFSNLYNDTNMTSFKNQVDNLKASMLTLKNSFAAAFRPIVEIAIPYIQKLIDYMIQLMNVVGQFMAAVTGQEKYTKAIKQTTAAIEDQNKAQKKQLSNLDNLNNLTSDTGAGAGADAAGTMFEEVPIESSFKDIADKVKDILSRFFEPLKKAWNSVGKKVMDAWKKALNNVWNLIKDIGRDFLKVWQEERTIGIFKNILEIIKDIGLAISNLAENFRKAWNENDTGLKILENIRNIIDVIIANIKHAADATVDWAANLNFTPLLEAFERFTASLEPVADALSGILTDFYEQVLLPLGKWTLEKGLPELLDVFTAFNEKVDWAALRENLSEFWDHLEPFAETVGEGLIIFIERVSDALANFLNSQEFKDFLTTVENWMDNVTPQDVADGLEKLAKGIIGLKIGLALWSGLSVALDIFSSFVKLITTAKFLKAIKTLGQTGDAAKTVGGLSGTLSSLGGLKYILTTNIGNLSELAAAGTAAEAGTIIGTSILSGLAGALAGGLEADFLNHYVIGPIVSLFDEELGNAYKNFSWFGDGGLFDSLNLEDFKGAISEVKKDFDKLVEGISQKWDDIKENAKTAWEIISSNLSEKWETIKSNASIKFEEIKSNISETWENAKTNLLEIWEALKTDASTKFGDIKTNLSEKWGDIKANTSEKWNDIKENLFEAWGSIKETASKKWESILSTISDIVDKVKEKIDGFITKMKDAIQSVKDFFASGVNNIGSKIGGFFGGGGNASAQQAFAAPTSYAAHPAIAALNNVEFPAYATGQVIPRTMKQHLAWLGDNDRETEVVSPLSTIEQAVINAMAKVNANNSNNGGGTVTIEIPVVIKGIGEIGRAVQQFDKEFFKQNNRHAFT